MQRLQGPVTFLSARSCMNMRIAALKNPIICYVHAAIRVVSVGVPKWVGGTVLWRGGGHLSQVIRPKAHISCFHCGTIEI